MKKIWLFLVLFLIPIGVSADNDGYVVSADDNVKLEENVNGSGVLVGNNVTVSKDINGIGLLAGNNVTLDGNIEYGLMFANNLDVAGTVSKDLLVAGNLVNFKESFKSNRDVFVFGNMVDLNGTIDRKTVIHASNVVISGAKLDDVTIYAPTIEIKGSVEINNLKYNKDAKITIDNAAVIGQTNLLDALETKGNFVDMLWNVIITYAGILLIFVISALVIPGLFKKLERQNDEVNFFKFFSLIGYGALALLILPIVCGLLFTLIVGIPLALLLLALYIIVVSLSGIFTGYLIGLLIWKKWIKKENNILLIGLLGISVITLLKLIPFVGTIVTFASLLIGLGIVIKLFKKDH